MVSRPHCPDSCTSPPPRLCARRPDPARRAQAIGVSRDWVAVAQDRDVWRRVVEEGSCSCLDSEGGTPSGVAPPCMSVNVSSGHELSVTEVSTADANPSSSQSSLAADQQPPERRLGRKAPAQTR